MDIKRLYRLYDHNTDSELLGEFTSFVNLWRSRSTDGAFPRLSDFGLEDFTAWRGRLSLGKIDDSNQLNMILWGTQLAYWWGIDYTDKPLGFRDDLYPAAWNEAEHTYLETLIKTQTIGIWQGNLNQPGTTDINIKCVEVPLAQDGQISHILSIYIKYQPGADIDIKAEPTYTSQYNE